MAQWVKNLTSIHEECGFDPCPCSMGQGSVVAKSCGVGCRRSLDPVLL